MTRALRYFVAEAASSLWRGRRTNAVAIVTIAAALFVLGAVLALTSNLQRIAARWSESAEFSIYLKDDASEADRRALERVIDADPLVAGREFVSKDEAMTRFRHDYAELSPGAAGLPENPFPASYEVRLKGTAGPLVEAMAIRVGGLGGVADVRYDRRWLDRLISLVRLIWWAGAILAAVLVVASALTIGNVVRLALHARRDEIEIMQLVGAPLAFIRGPFVVEGIVQGACGTLIGLGTLWAAFALVRTRAAATVDAIAGPGLLDPPALAQAGLLLLGGIVVGCVGGYVAARAVR